ncbi:unnamed protein product [Periconia digitata]|uniref:polynucleotide adenylyltransferase n=1 Tax=Periconia digitata TaxID=1303443 RepID=A0A9W4UQS0_9PLEO|nr:unnamed protein product [Periconia digitata]
MATMHQPPHLSSFATTSHDTALCIIPSEQHCRSIESLRALYDKGYGNWPPHINLVYPFVAPESLHRAKFQVEQCFRNAPGTISQNSIILDRAGYFEHRNNSTVFLQASGESSDILSSIRSFVLKSLGNEDSPSKFHLTIGQSSNESQSTREFLLSKINLLPPLTLAPHHLVILVREKAQVGGERSSKMRVWDVINIHNQIKQVPEYWLNHDDFENQGAVVESSNEETSGTGYTRQPEPGSTYEYNTHTRRWCVADGRTVIDNHPETFSISSYNVLTDSRHPVYERESLLLDTILSKPALAEVLLLQEMSDDFLSCILSNDDVRQRYPFASHAPPSQSDIGPLPSLRNIVILSKWRFEWEYIPFQRRHKGAVVAKIPGIVGLGVAEKLPLVIAGVHLTCGLTDGSVAAKKAQLQYVISHLNQKYPDSPWIIAGDFNITTSEHTIQEAVKNKAISARTEQTIRSIDSMLRGSGLLDSWIKSRVEGTSRNAHSDREDLLEGEEGATFNPRDNLLAASTSGTSNGRPQRYDRILYRPQDSLYIGQFNDFGLPQIRDGVMHVPSDHSGVRASLTIRPGTLSAKLDHSLLLSEYPVRLQSASPSLFQQGNVAQTLQKLSVFPSAEQRNERKEAFDLLKSVVLGMTAESKPSNIPMIMVPVGSYALGVWTAESDIDCLCIGTTSSKTFFRLAIQRIRRNESQKIRLIRKVEASTGTMLELSINGISMDLQYCPATAIVYRWSEFPSLAASDPIFNLPILSLRKLKPLRDLNSILSSMPSKSTFRLAYHFIKLWAMKKGIYAGKFGFLSGTHIALMLSWVCKRLAHDTGSIATGDLIVSFFHHYANFDWQNEIVFDAFFHSQKPRYHRSAREPMVILGYHAPHSNIAHTATRPGLNIIVQELKGAAARLSMPDMTWGKFFESSNGSLKSSDLTIGASQFLQVYENYVKIDIQYWGRSLSKGRSLVGWLESRCIGLVVEIYKTLPNLTVRIWPARFAEPGANDSATEYYGCYLIGLSRNQSTEGPDGIEERAKAKRAMDNTLDHFLTQLRGDQKYYDSDSCWVDTSISRPGEVRELALDKREWGDCEMEIESDSEDEDEVDVLADECASSTPSKLLRHGASTQSSTPVSTSKLRPASDVLNRLRWDPSLDGDNYIVGYEDRFLGAREMALGKWKTEQTDMEFIPQHRILYFKRKDESIDGEVVWERATRIDKVFGSGVGSGNSIT